MAFDEKRAWIMVVTTIGAYTAYLVAVLGRADHGPLTQAPYVAALLWSVGGAIAASIVLQIVVTTASPRGAGKKDQRDREIGRFGDHIGQSFVVLGGAAALCMSMAAVDRFWISNEIYLGFVLSSLLGSTAKVVAYRRGLPTS
jgi:hypothetical protein